MVQIFNKCVAEEMMAGDNSKTEKKDIDSQIWEKFKFLIKRKTPEKNQAFVKWLSTLFPDPIIQYLLGHLLSKINLIVFYSILSLLIPFARIRSSFFKVND